MKNIMMKFKKAVIQKETRFHTRSPVKVSRITLILIVVIFSGQSYLLANECDTNEEKGFYFLPNIQEFEALNDPHSEDYGTLVRKIAPVIYSRCDKDLENVEGGDYLKAFLAFYSPGSEKYQSLGKDQRQFIDMCYDCFAL